MKSTKLFLYVSIFCLILTSFGCAEKPYIAPTCEDKVPVTIIIDPAILSFCKTSASQGETPVDFVVEITVSGTKSINNVSTDLNNEFDQTYDLKSDAPTTKNFDIQVPACGTFEIDVLIRGKDGSCMTCCSKMQKEGSAGVPCPDFSTSGKGTPKFRVTTVKINATLSTPPATEMRLTPKFTTCKCC